MLVLVTALLRLSVGTPRCKGISRSCTTVRCAFFWTKPPRVNYTHTLPPCLAFHVIRDENIRALHRPALAAQSGEVKNVSTASAAFALQRLSVLFSKLTRRAGASKPRSASRLPHDSAPGVEQVKFQEERARLAAAARQLARLHRALQPRVIQHRLKVLGRLPELEHDRDRRRAARAQAARVRTLSFATPSKASLRERDEEPCGTGGGGRRGAECDRVLRRGVR